ncbi:hypothetical protein HZC31_03795 [Candidatus Woesearchaeota archaeon]|nr:hypothetical protein [Candidatus Woesearchaeota archaeon]
MVDEISKNGLEALLLFERQELTTRVIAGEFGVLESFYTPFEQRLVKHAELADFYLQRIFSGVIWLTGYLPIIHVMDTSAQTAEGTTDDAAKNDDTQLVLNPDSLLQGLSSYSSLSLTTLVKTRVNAHVAEDFFQRKYTQLENGEAACAQNLASLNKRIEDYEKKQRTLFDRALEIRKSYDQREIAIAEYEAMKRALEEDHESCRFAIQSYSDEILCNAGFEFVTDGSDSTRDYETNRRLLLVIQQESYATAQKLQDERSKLIDEKRDLDFLEQAATVITAGLMALYQNREMIHSNQTQMQHQRLIIDQKRVTYETCVEMYQFAVAVPEPEESRTLIASIEQGIGKLQQYYREKFGLGSGSQNLGGP